MQIVNATKNSLLVDKASIADTFWKRVVGLLGRKGLEEKGGLVIRPCSSIHTFFMRFSIDIIFLDKHSRVTKIIRNMPPFRLSLPAFAAKCVIELPSGAIARSRTEIGDLIEFRD